MHVYMLRKVSYRLQGARGWVKRTRGSCFIGSYIRKEMGVSLCPNSDAFRAVAAVASLIFFFFCADGMVIRIPNDAQS